jgi:hypothetical protein
LSKRFSKEDGWEIDDSIPNNIKLIKTERQICPLHKSYRHLGVKDGNLVVYEGPLGFNNLIMQQEKIKLVSMADARGIEIRDDEILYITECQNTSVDLLKLCLSRASSGCKIFIEGDYNTQVDSYLFDGNKNGMIRAIDVLKGENIFGYVELQHVWRSKIAELVDKL